MRVWRESRNWTLSYVGSQIGRGERQVWNMEQRAMAPQRRTTLRAIANLYGFDPDAFVAEWFLGETSGMKIAARPRRGDPRDKD